MNEKERSNFYLFLYEYETIIKGQYSSYHWDNQELLSFCSRNGIGLKVRSNTKKVSNYFWFETFTDSGTGVNDIAHHWMRHIRNSIAHGNVQKMKGLRPYYVFDDYKKAGTKHTAHGVIQCDLFWKMLEKVKQTHY